MTFTLLKHERLDQLHESQRGHGSDAEALLKVAQILFHQGPWSRRDGVINQDIDAFKAVMGVRDEAVQRVKVADIALEGPALCAKALRNLGAGVLTLFSVRPTAITGRPFSLVKRRCLDRFPGPRR